MKKQHYSISINAPVTKVWDTMLSQETYKIWTAPFSPGSYFEGSWDKGAKIKFLGPDNSGMMAEIAENKGHEFISIRHLGYIHKGVEDTTSPEVRAWAPAYENYTFKEENGVTTLTIDQDVTEEYDDMMSKMWPKALDALKKLCEK